MKINGSKEKRVMIPISDAISVWMVTIFVSFILGWMAGVVYYEKTTISPATLQAIAEFEAEVKTILGDEAEEKDDMDLILY